jgi:S-formylglutathione hydrolase FrmB
MAIAHVNYFNKALQKEVAFYALLPDRQEKPGPYPVYYLLHGLSDDYTAWLRWTSIERYVRELPLIVVLPDGDRYWYSDIPDGPPYEKALVGDLIPYVDSIFPTVASREGRVIGGLSMGGYGAMKLALKYPEMFCSVAGHSGAYRAKKDARFAGLTDCCFELAEQLVGKEAPAIRFDCGVDDFLLDHNREFHAHLERLGIPHEYWEFPGAHTWEYWDLHVQEAIAFHCKVLGIEKDK